MSRRLCIPARATCIDRLQGVANQGPHKGKKVDITIWEARMSKGYKSNYEPVRTVYLKSIIEGIPTQVWSHTGKNIDEAYEDFRHVTHLIS